jgi:general secretion pathway protein A
MYTRFFGLTAEPFSLSPDPNFFFLSDSHANALAALKIGIRGRRGLMVMTGEVGTGKTTLLYSLLGEIGPRIQTAYLSNTKLGFDGMLRLALMDFGVRWPGRERADMMVALNRFLRRCAEEKTVAALIVDEAQNLDEDTFEHIRLLSNFETFAAKLLQIILVGQPELEFKLRQPNLRQVAERVAVRCHLDPLSGRESEAYLDHRLRRVEAQPDLFNAGARRVILRAAQGVPRRINILCDNALLFAYGRSASRVTKAEARLAVRERGTLLTPAPPRRPSRSTPGWRGLPSSRVAATALLLITAAGAMHWWYSRAALGTGVAAGSRGPSSNGPEVVGNSIELLAEHAEVLAASPPRSSNAALGTIEPAAAPQPQQAAIGDSAHSAAEPLMTGPTVSQATAPEAVEPVDRFGGPFAAARSGQSPPSAAPAELVDPPRLHLAAVLSTADVAASTSAPTEDDSPGFRTVRVPAGSTLLSLTREVYGLVDSGLIARIQSANPRIVDADHILAGDTLRFPDVEPHTNRLAVEHP